MIQTIDLKKGMVFERGGKLLKVLQILQFLQEMIKGKQKEF